MRETVLTFRFAEPIVTRPEEGTKAAELQRMFRVGRATA
jgi:hypothetical protein